MGIKFIKLSVLTWWLEASAMQLDILKKLKATESPASLGALVGPSQLAQSPLFSTFLTTMFLCSVLALTSRTISMFLYGSWSNTFTEGQQKDRQHMRTHIVHFFAFLASSNLSSSDIRWNCYSFAPGILFGVLILQCCYACYCLFLLLLLLLCPVSLMRHIAID